MTVSDRLYVVGSLNLDVFSDDNGTTWSTLGGMAFNAWRALQEMGVDSDLVSTVGADDTGDRIIELARDEGVPLDLVFRHGASASGLAKYSVSERGAKLTELRLRPPIGWASFAASIDFTRPVLGMGVCASDAKLLARAPTFFWNPGLGVLSTGHDAHEWPIVTILFANRAEWDCYRSCGGPTPKVAVVTDHAAGASLLIGGVHKLGVTPPMRVAGVDVGAGDALAAAFTRFFLEGHQPAVCLARAVDCAYTFLLKRSKSSRSDVS